MTRESRARALAFATALLVVLLAALFAALRNLAPPATAPMPRPGGAALDTGRAAFVAKGCSACHAAEGRGNPSLPLDGVGARFDREALRAAAFGTSPRLPPNVVDIKRARAGDPDADALLDYLQQLR